MIGCVVLFEKEYTEIVSQTFASLIFIEILNVYLEVIIYKLGTQITHRYAVFFYIYFRNVYSLYDNDEKLFRCYLHFHMGYNV